MLMAYNDTDPTFRWRDPTSDRFLLFFSRARNNGRSTDNVWTDWEVDLSTFRLAGHVQVTFHRIENEMN